MVAVVLGVVLVPRVHPATGTLLVAVAGRTDASLPRSPLMVHACCW